MNMLSWLDALLPNNILSNEKIANKLSLNQSANE